MTINRISFQKGYKYQLVEDYTVHTGIQTLAGAKLSFIEIEPDGTLTIKAGYAWDGPSGPTVDTLNFMRGALVHDALYQLMREGALDSKTHRDIADRLLRDLCKQDGMSALRAWWVYRGVRFGGGPSADERGIKPIMYAPAQWTPAPLFKSQNQETAK